MYNRQVRPRIVQTVRFLPHPRIAQTVWFRQSGALVSGVHLCSWGRLRTISGLSLASLTSRVMRNWVIVSARHAMNLWLQQWAACAIIGWSARSVPTPLANLMRAFSHHENNIFNWGGLWMLYNTIWYYTVLYHVVRVGSNYTK